jgi:hypothetical protein
MKRTLATGCLLLIAACKSPASTNGSASAAATTTASPTPRWFAEARTYDNGPAIDALAPSLSLCVDGRYVTQESYAVDPSFPHPTRLGKACCRDGEGGSYELLWSGAGVLEKIHLTSDTGVQRDLPVSSTGSVLGAEPRVDTRFCPSRARVK